MNIYNIYAKSSGKTYDVDYDALPEVSRAHIIEYGLKQYLRDAAASAKTPDEAHGLISKRVDNLKAGVLRASVTREGDPIRARAMQLVLAALKRSPKVQAHLTQHGYKPTDREAIAFVREIAEKQLSVPGNKWTAQATIDVAAAKALAEVEIDI